MALTKEALLTSLCTFKAELREQHTADFKSTLEALQSDITSRMTSLQADVDSVWTRTLDLETQIQEIKQQVSRLEKEVSQLKSQLQLSILKCKDLENRSQRDNIRVRGLEEGSEGPGLEAFVMGLFSALLGDDHPEVQIERVHRVGSSPTIENKRPHDILVKLSSFKVKERILQKARQQDVVYFQGAQCALFQGIAPVTLHRWQRFRPIKDELKVRNIWNRWTFPFGISFELNNKPYHFVESREAVAALGLP
ncbi:hypothetical protein NDU88_002002 [Pleurodeles waltl]|uniref:L1 transposable element RRM domain-containing protein n=1 Tax=Pleurodeles waltl TaxID=8319 RepID=A0AAV7SAE0_PLEWA|nr:hypothetical protein NDU88_002002 [Pleurodeles waltl]